VADYELTEAQLREGYERCIENVQNLLDSVKLLLEGEDSHQYALGLYMYAIEEYGKAEILRDYIMKNKSKYSVPEWIFGRGKVGRKGHDRKLSVGFNRLPSICRRLSRRIEITSNTSGNIQTFTIEKDGIPIGSISVPQYLSGTFEDPTHVPKRTVDFDLKAACFYVDWDNTNDDWKYFLPADKNQLTDNIKRMKGVLSQKS
jgi:AbiV family abortive infection protein